MNISHLKLYVFFACLSLSHAQAEDNETAELGRLSVDELSQLEVDLDNTFDVFDALFKTPRSAISTGGAEQSPAYAPAITSIITAQDIKAMGAEHLDEVLRTVPGLYVGVANVGNYMANYSMRGLRDVHSQSFLIMLNGIPLKHMFSRNAWSIMHNGRYPVKNIARVEVIRGPASALHGADAASGVINIITKTAEDLQGTETGVRLGSYSSENVWLQHGNTYDDVAIAVSLEYQQSDGHRAIIQADTQTYYDQLNGTNFSATPGTVNNFSRQFQMAVQIAWQHWNLFLQDRQHRHGPAMLTRGFMPVTENQQDISLQLFKLTYDNPEIARYWAFKTHLMLQHFGWQDVSPRTLFVPGAWNNRFPHGQKIIAHMQDTMYQLDFSLAYSGIPDHYLLFNGGYAQGDLYEVEQFVTAGRNPATGLPIRADEGFVDISDSPYLSVKEGLQENYWLLFQDTWQFAEHWSLTSGLRYDWFSRFGDVWTPRFSLGWQIRQNLYARLMYSQAFVIPSLTELTASLPPLVGNPDLQPMQHESIEFALNYQARKHLNFALNLFATRQRDQIQQVQSLENNQPAFWNLGKAHSYGVELEMRWKPSQRSSLLMNYAFANAHDEKIQDDFAAVPNHSAYLRHDYLLYPRWYLDTQLYWAGDFKRAANDPRDKADAQFSLDLTLRYKHPSGIDLAVGLRNLSNNDNRDPAPGPNQQGITSYPYDFPLAGRTGFAEMSYRFD